jgi:hypothetical protein
MSFGRNGDTSMRIAYVVHLDVSKESGLLKKIISQVKLWNHWGSDTRLFVANPGTRVWCGLSDLPVTIVTYKQGNVRRLRASDQLGRRVFEWNPDLVYMRDGAYCPAWGRLSRGFRTIMEVNTDKDAEYKLTVDRLQYAYHKVTGHILTDQAAGLVFVTHELCDRFPEKTKPRVVIPNSFDLRVVPEMPGAVRTEEAPNLVFVGSRGAVWHGVDMIPAIASRLPDHSFDVVGYAPADTGRGVPQNVHLHGHLGKKGYEGILRRADVAVSSLALFRIGLEEASPLKTREYLAYGLPVIMGYTDSDFPDPVPFILKVDMRQLSYAECAEAIRSFTQSWRGQRVPRDCITHVDLQAKEQRRLSFFEEIASRSRSSHPVRFV